MNKALIKILVLGHNVTVTGGGGGPLGIPLGSLGINLHENSYWPMGCSVLGDVDNFTICQFIIFCPYYSGTSV